MDLCPVSPDTFDPVQYSGAAHHDDSSPLAREIGGSDQRLNRDVRAAPIGVCDVDASCHHVPASTSHPMFDLVGGDAKGSTLTSGDKTILSLRDFKDIHDG